MVLLGTPCGGKSTILMRFKHAHGNEEKGGNEEIHRKILSDMCEMRVSLIAYMECTRSSCLWQERHVQTLEERRV